MRVQPAATRYNLENDGSDLRITIPSRKHWFQIIFLGFWSIMWAFFTIAILTSVIATMAMGLESTESAGPFSFGLVFMLLWLTVWVGGGIFAVYTFLWQLIGREIIEVRPDAISITRKVLGFERPKIYDASHIKDLRVSPFIPQTSWPGMYTRNSLFRITGTLAFDYGAKTYRFGDMEEAEAKMVLADILRSYPQYGRK